MVLETLSIEIAHGHPRKLLYNNDLVLVTEPLESPRDSSNLERSNGVKKMEEKC